MSVVGGWIELETMLSDHMHIRKCPRETPYSVQSVHAKNV
jgi:hypothetical protein